MTTTTPDPIADGAAYRAHLIGLLEGDDPLEVASATPAALRTIAAAAGDALRTRPEPREWSPLECIAHVADAEIVATARYRWVLAHDEPDLVGYDQDLWVDRLHGEHDDPEAILSLFDALRAANIALWKQTPVADRERAGLHRERGRETYGEMFALYAGHDRFHLAQAKKAFAGR